MDESFNMWQVAIVRGGMKTVRSLEDNPLEGHCCYNICDAGILRERHVTSNYVLPKKGGFWGVEDRVGV